MRAPNGSHPITTTTVTNGQLGQPTAVAAVRSCHGGGGATFVTMTGTVAPACAAATRACCSSGSAVVAPGWMNVISAASLGDGSDGYASASVRSRLLPDVTLAVPASNRRSPSSWPAPPEKNATSSSSVSSCLSALKSLSLRTATWWQRSCGTISITASASGGSSAASD